MPVSLKNVGRWVAAFTSSCLRVKAPNGLALKDEYDSIDNTWTMDWRSEGTVYTREDASAVANNLVNIRSKRTCSFCNRVEITRP